MDLRDFLFFLSAALFFAVCNPAPAQTFTLTEAQLQELETLSNNYRTSRQKQLQQVNELQTEAQNLKTALQQEQQTTSDLKKSCEKSETQLLQTTAKLTKTQLKIKNQQIAIIVMAAIILLLILSDVVYILIKLKVI